MSKHQKGEESGFVRKFENEYEYTNGHDRRKRRWNDQDRKLRKERRHPRENEMSESLDLQFPEGFKR